MVDNRSAGFYGIGGSFNFKSGDISGTAAGTQDDKMGQGTEYAPPQEKKDESEELNQSPYMDRSAQLNATLSSLAMMNAAQIHKPGKMKKDKDDNREREETKQKNTAKLNRILELSSDEDQFIDT